MRIAFLGQRGSYTEAAAAWMFPDRDVATVPCPGVEALLNTLREGKAGLGVLRFETSEWGTNYELLDLLRHEALFFQLEMRFHERYNLAGPRVAGARQIRRVCAHPTILHLCGNYLSRMDIEAVARWDSQAMLQAATNPEAGDTAVVCGDFAAEVFGLSVIEAGIENSGGGVTRFVALGPELTAPAGDNVSTCAMFELKHQPGALMAALAAFGKLGINLSRVSGRPNRAARADYTMYIEFPGRHSDPENHKALDELREHTAFLQLLGSYQSTEPRQRQA